MKKKKRSKIKHAVVMINYKKWEDTEVAINSINNSKDKPHIIVVDNGSGNDSIPQLKKRFPDLDLIDAGGNVGFSVGNNIGIKKALRMGAKVVHILNNDTEVDPNLFYRAFRYVDGKNRIAGAKIYYAKGYEYHDKQKGRGDVIWYAGGYMDWGMAIARHFGVDEVDKGQHDKELDVEFITGCYIAVPRKVFKKIGMLDEPFFLYLEDSDYCLKAAKAGIEVKYNPKLMVYHRNSSTTVSGSPLVDYYITRNRFMIGKRYGSLRLQFALFREAIFRNWSSPIRRAAFLDFLTNNFGNKNDKIFAISAKMAK
jgi:GT2 family glycosyltransferase